MSIGFRVFLKRELPAAEVVEGFRSLPAANIADCMGRLSALSQEIRLLSSPEAEIMVGTAVTVKARPGDNLMIHKALNLAGPGDVIVVANEGDRSQSLVGEIMITYAKHKKISGLVLDGAIRDIGAISGMDIPVYGTGFTPGGPYKDGPGEVNVVACIGGSPVYPGDIIIGDADGVLAIPRAGAADLARLCHEQIAREKKILASIADGTVDRRWVDEMLKAKGMKL
jgi:regulator of RNase E activity RraA